MNNSFRTTSFFAAFLLIFAVTATEAADNGYDISDKKQTPNPLR